MRSMLYTLSPVHTTVGPKLRRETEVTRKLKLRAVQTLNVKSSSTPAH